MKWLSLFFESMKVSSRLDSTAGDARLGHAEHLIASHCDDAQGARESMEIVETAGHGQAALMTQFRTQ